MHGDPIGYFLTWVTYGTWLPGDARGWVEYRHGWQLPDPIREREAKARMTEDACILTHEQRRAVEAQIADSCAHRRWALHVVNCRSNHVHVVVTADVANPKKIRIDLKAWATRMLKQKFDGSRENWWAECGSIRYLNTDEDLEAAILYVRDGQDIDRHQPDASARPMSECHASARHTHTRQRCSWRNYTMPAADFSRRENRK
jgi:REP element-mobilizing transposase RayT